MIRDPETPPLPTPRISGLAILSMILGIASFLTFGLTAIPAIILGHIARADIRKEPGRFSGGGQALTGLIAGYLGIVFGAFLILAALLGIIAIGLHSPR